MKVCFFYFFYCRSVIDAHVDVPSTNVVADVQPEIERTGNVDLNILPIQDEPLLMLRLGFSDETDIFISMALKEKVWNFEYVDLALFLIQSFVSNINDQPLNLEILNGKLFAQKKQNKMKKIDNIST